MVYLKLFHGRTDPNHYMDEWGTIGPTLGPYDYVHTTYTTLIRLGRGDSICDELHIVEKDLIYYDGVYYGDWSVTDNPKIAEQAEKYDASKAVRKAN